MLVVQVDLYSQTIPVASVIFPSLRPDVGLTVLVQLNHLLWILKAVSIAL